ncbi:MAG: protein phosphatase 2C domain-containing protein [Actinomycetota bacterium]
MHTTITPAGVTDAGHVRPVNQDCFGADDDLFVVADGMGDQGRGETASRLATAALRASFAADPTATGLIRAVSAANTAVWERAQSEPQLAGMGTTIAAVARVGDDGDRLVVVNVGDSRVYLFRDGRLTRLSADHSLVADLVRSGEISEAEATDHPERHRLTHAVGVGPHVAPHVSHTMATPSDRLLLCSDGLFNEITPEEITEVLAIEAATDAAADRLVTLANANGGSDNITAVVLDVT